MIPYGFQDVSDADIEAVIDVLKSDFLTQGPKVPAFEAALAAHVGAAHGVAVNSATSALHIACRALGLGPGEWLWTSPITFVATANAALYCGASIDFVDIDSETYNMCPKALEQKLKAAAAADTLPKVVAPVDMCGQSCDMAAIYALSQEFGFRILEDASHAVGGLYQGRPIGDGRYSDITVFSFHPVKIITSAEGGMAMTNDPDLAARMELLRSHGITRDPARMTCEPDGPWYYQQLDLGFNYRMTEMQAALGLSQLDRLDAFVARRSELASGYERLLDGLPLCRPVQRPDTASAWHLYVIQAPGNGSSVSHRALFEGLRAAGIGVNLHYIPVHMQPFYRRLGFGPGNFPAAEAYYGRAISLPLFVTMTEEQQKYIVKTIERLLV